VNDPFAVHVANSVQQLAHVEPGLVLVQSSACFQELDEGLQRQNNREKAQALRLQGVRCPESTDRLLTKLQDNVNIVVVFKCFNKVDDILMTQSLLDPDFRQ
jgi:hypothetical protein